MLGVGRVEATNDTARANRADLLLLLAVTLPPQALEGFGPVTDERTVETAYGGVGPLALRRTNGGQRVWIQPYSGLPTRTDPRATLRAAKKLGVQRIFAWDAGVALNPVLGRGQPLIVTDYIDFTRHQPQTFFETEGVGGIGPAPPVCPQMTAALARALPTAPDGVYLGVDGPRRETAAEARMFRLWGADVLGQNLVPEMALARELGLCCCGLVTVADISADQPPVSPRGEVRRGMEQVVEALSGFLESLGEEITCGCHARVRS